MAAPARLVRNPTTPAQTAIHISSVITLLPVVRRLAGDHDVVDVAFAQARPRDADKARPALELLDVRRPDIAHGSPQATDELVDHRTARALVRHLAFAAF